MMGYRFVTEDLRSEHGDVQWKIGEWQKQQGELKLCENGFHASKEPIDSLQYIFGSRWFLCEAKGTMLKSNDKFCASEMRLIKEIPQTVLVKFAIDCAKRVLSIFEKEYPNDKRPRQALEAVEAWLKESTEENREKCDAAWAAGAAARAAGAATWAAWAAARAAWAAGVTARAAGAATWAARAAARAARAAGDAERKWQRKYLKQLVKEAS